MFCLERKKVNDLPNQHAKVVSVLYRVKKKVDSQCFVLKEKKVNDLPNQHGKSLQSQGRVSKDRGEGAALPSTTP